MIVDLLLIIPILILQLVFVVLRLNDHIEWLWSLIFIPLWCIIGFGVLIVTRWFKYYYDIMTLSSSESVGDQQVDAEDLSEITVAKQIVAKIPYYYIAVISLTLFSVFIPVQLDTAFTSWSIVFIPLWFFMLVEIITFVYEKKLWQFNNMVPTYQRQPITLDQQGFSQQENNFYNEAIQYPQAPRLGDSLYGTTYVRPYTLDSPSYYMVKTQNLKFMFRAYVMYHALTYAALISFSIVLALKLDNILSSTDWSIIFIPAWIFLGLIGILFFFREIQQFIRTRRQFLQTIDHGSWLYYFFRFITYGAVLVFTILLEHDLREPPFDPLGLFSPLFIALIFIWLICWFRYYFPVSTGTFDLNPNVQQQPPPSFFRSSATSSYH